MSIHNNELHYYCKFSDIGSPTLYYIGYQKIINTTAQIQVLNKGILATTIIQYLSNKLPKIEIQNDGTITLDYRGTFMKIEEHLITFRLNQPKQPKVGS